MSGTPSRTATHEEEASASLGVSWSEEASESAEVPVPATAAQSALSDEADSSESTAGSPTRALTPMANQPNRWCVDALYQVYSDAKFLNENGVMTRTLTLEMRVLTGSLPTMPAIHNLFTGHRLEWTAHSLGRYSEELVREFYASYVDTLKSRLRGGLPPPNTHLSMPEYVAFRLISPWISIHRYLYGKDVDANRTPLTTEFDYRWQIIKDG